MAPADLRHLFGPGDRVLHLDLHPANVMLTAAGPVVIDWTNAAAGPAGADVALADLIMATADIDDLPGWLRRAFLRGFRRAVRDDPGPYLAEVARYRLADANIRPDEAERVRRLAALSPRAR